MCVAISNNFIVYENFKGFLILDLVFRNNLLHQRGSANEMEFKLTAVDLKMR